MKVEKLTTNRVKFTFTVHPDEFEHGLDHAFEHVKGDVEIKGFRKGHVPRNVFETKIGVETLFEDAINHVLQHKFQEAHAHPDYEIVGQPDVDLDMTKVERGKAFEVIFEVPVKPEVKLGVYKDIEVKEIKTTVSDSEVNAEIKMLLSEKAQLVLKETGALEFGDTAIFDFEGFLNDEPFEGGKAESYQLEIGSNQFIPGFEDQMVGMNAGEEKDLDVTFPENYQAENLAGQAVVFKVKLHEIKIKELPELNDEFVKSLERENVETVEALQAETKKDLEAQKANEADQLLTSTIIDKILETAEIDLPQAMIEQENNQQIDNIKRQAQQYGLEYEMFLQMNGLTPEQLDAQLTVESEKRLLTSLAMEEIGKVEGITVSKEELDEKYTELSEQYQMAVEEIKRYVPEQVLEQDIIISKAFQFVKDHAKRV
ncbi:MAG: trigger factor [Acholeplasmataceae bacterium]|nr:trigger factor [Acholeplasmataceae bacterium]